VDVLKVNVIVALRLVNVQVVVKQQLKNIVVRCTQISLVTNLVHVPNVEWI
jgi:hypothetical protein